MDPLDFPKISTVYRVGFRDWMIASRVEYDPAEIYAREPEEVPYLMARNRSMWSLDGPTRARCLPLRSGRVRTQGGDSEAGETIVCEHAPQKSCQCGLYTQHLPQRLTAFGVGIGVAGSIGQAYGAVLGWGRRFRHGEEGFRAEYMKPVAFWIPPHNTYHRPPSTHVELIVDIADRLDAKIFSRVAEMARYAFTLGETWHPLGQRAVDEYFGERRWSRGIRDDVRKDARGIRDSG